MTLYLCFDLNTQDTVIYRVKSFFSNDEGVFVQTLEGEGLIYPVPVYLAVE